MARTGRPPKPFALRVLEGNPGKRKMPKDIPQPIKMFNAPDPPERLNEVALYSKDVLLLTIEGTQK